MDGEHEVNGDKMNLHIPPISSVTPFFDWSFDLASRYDQFSRGHPFCMWQTLFTCLQS